MFRSMLARLITVLEMREESTKGFPARNAKVEPGRFSAVPRAPASIHGGKWSAGGMMSRGLFNHRLNPESQSVSKQIFKSNPARECQITGADVE